MDKQFLKTRRESLKMSQSAAAAALSVDRRLYGKWERGERCVPREWRARVAGLLGLAVECLQQGERQRDLPASLSNTRRSVRRSYPVRGSVDDVARLGRQGTVILNAAREVVDTQNLASEFPHDTPHELLLLLTVVAFGGSLVWARPLRFGCPLLILDDFRSEYGGDQLQWAVVWEQEGEIIVIFGQIRLKAVFGRDSARVDFLVYHKARGRRGQWMTVELDGSQHASQPAQDKERAENLLIPEIRYDNQKLLGESWFHRFLEDVRAASVRGARNEASRNERSDEFRREREETVRQREEER